MFFKATWSWYRLLCVCFVFVDFNYRDLLFNDLIYYRLNRFRHWKGLHLFDCKIQIWDALFLGLLIFDHSSIQHGFLLRKFGRILQQLMSSIPGQQPQIGGRIFHFMLAWWWMRILVAPFFRWFSIYTFTFASWRRFVTSLPPLRYHIICPWSSFPHASSVMFSMRETSTEGISHAIFSLHFFCWTRV